MKYKNTLIVLNANAAEIQRIIERMEESDTIHAIDLDLMLEKLRAMYDVVNDLRSEVSQVPEPVESSVSHDAHHEEDKGAIDLTPEVEDSSEKKLLEREVEKVQPVRKEIKSETKLRDEENSEKDGFLSDKFKSEKPTLNEEIGSQAKQEDLSSQLNTNPITSLTGAIGLNEKFELINELFDGNKNTFDHTMQVLNASASFVEAYSYLEENFEWDMENQYVQRILELIRRKLIVRRNEQ